MNRNKEVVVVAFILETTSYEQKRHMKLKDPTKRKGMRDESFD